MAFILQQVHGQLRLEPGAYRRDIAIMFAVVLASGIGTAIYMYSMDRYALTYYGDAASHLILSRKIVDSENLGWDQIGTVWLPLPHLLLLLPSLEDTLFFTGFAGLVVSLPSLALTCVFLYKTVGRMLSKVPRVDARLVPYVALASALLYGLNPNAVYLGITAMTEAAFLLFFVGAAYFLLRWVEEYKDNKQKALWYLLACAGFTCAATLCRYEGWVLPPVLAVSVAVTIGRKKGDVISGRSALYAIAVVAVSMSGMTFWFAFNEVKYGDPLEFADAKYYSAAYQAMNRPFREALFLQPAHVANVYAMTIVMVYGPVLLASAAMGYFMYHWSDSRLGGTRHLYAFLAAVPAFTAVSMLAGIGEMTFWFNSRFVIFLAPLLVLLAGSFIARQPGRIASSRALLTGVVVALFAFQPLVLAFGTVVTLEDAKGGFAYRQTPYAIAAGENLSSIYDGNGSIIMVTGSAQEHRIVLASGIALRNFDSMVESSNWKPHFYEPWQSDGRLIVLAKDPDSDAAGVVEYWSEHRSELDMHYYTVYENQYYEVLAKR